MEQPALVIKILRRLSKAGVLERLLLIGSWCGAFYKDYFKNALYAPVLRTRDIDFLVPVRPRFPNPIDLEMLLADLGFEVTYGGSGLMRLESEDLSVELLIPEVGPPKTKPHPVPDLKFNAQPIRHLSMLWRDPICVTVSDIPVRLPHPADFGLHKLFISERRKNTDKRAKDLEMAFAVLDALLEKGEEGYLVEAFQNTTPNEQKSIMKLFKKNGREDLMQALRA